ncbi:FYN-binding protein 1-like [Mobula birostris]|uniref:FYN-binding protein 1-like n=1 Tax=Mobula birostris TaxID=1983395 RepID=UPI003B285407
MVGPGGGGVRLQDSVPPARWECERWRGRVVVWDYRIQYFLSDGSVRYGVAGRWCGISGFSTSCTMGVSEMTWPGGGVGLQDSVPPARWECERWRGRAVVWDYRIQYLLPDGSVRDGVAGWWCGISGFSTSCTMGMSEMTWPGGGVGLQDSVPPARWECERWRGRAVVWDYRIQYLLPDGSVRDGVAGRWCGTTGFSTSCPMGVSEMAWPGGGVGLQDSVPPARWECESWRGRAVVWDYRIQYLLPDGSVRDGVAGRWCGTTGFSTSCPMGVSEMAWPGGGVGLQDSDGRLGVKALLAKFDDKALERVPARGSQKLTVPAHAPILRNMSSVASKAAAFESSSASGFPLNRTAGSFSEKPNQAADKPIFPKPSAVKAQQEARDTKPPFPKPNVGAKPSLNTSNAVKEEQEEKSPFAKFGLRPTADSGSTHKESEAQPTFPKPSAFAKPSNAGNPSENRTAFSRNQFLKLNSPAGGVSPGKPVKPAFPKSTGLKPWNDHSGPPKENADNARKEDGGSERSGGPFLLQPLKPVGEQAKGPVHGGEETKSENLKPSALRNLPPRAKPEGASSAPSGPSKFLQRQNQFQNKVQSQENEQGQKDTGVPKRKTLPAPWTLGPPPQKPNRPPNVNLERFRKPQEKLHPPTPGSSRDAVKPPPTPGFPVPNLPPRSVGNKPPEIIPMTEEEEDNYDDVQSFDQVPPPLPPMKLEDRRRPVDANSGESKKDDSDGEMYEDLDSYRSRKELKEQEKKREKEEKRKQEQEQREKKREQEMRKKFKFSGPIEVIQTVKVTTDYKGGKNELSCRQGDYLEVIRITDNPEGKWLARTMDGTYGYIKVTCVDINYDEIRKKTIGKAKDSAALKTPVQDQELYDDVAPTNDIGLGTGNSSTGSSGGFPPPPPGEEIYDDVDEIPEDVNPTPQDASKLGSWSWALLRKKKVETDSKEKKSKEKESSEIQGESGERQLPSASMPSELAAGGEDIYDDVGAEDFPPPPPEFSLKPGTPNKGRKDDKDAKRMKKLEKEEKDFRKKFKVNLLVKAGETLDIIQHTDNIKLLCRNEDGKFGYVQKVNLVVETAGGDGEIYDDIDTECIYDND